MKTSLSAHAVRVGGFFLILYLLCLIWQMWSTDAAVQAFHLTSLKFLFPGFSGFTLASILLGGAWSFVYGFVGSYAFHRFHASCCTPQK
ncbi:hypothetical protein HYV73_02370 [Candidatus Uhrbacteria bacterium]|nr:hypothetical protein [Candidatus Uhrbacteria bacterium]